MLIENIEQQIKEIISREGFSLYDIEYPRSYTSGVITVYIFSKDKAVSLDDCATISKKISILPEYESSLSEKVSLVVSSPGVNRALKVREHFLGAVSERVKVKLRDMQENKKSFIGILKSIDGDILNVFDEALKKEVQIKYDNIISARVDFDFG
ncbi:MAG: ribosome maturation factor RimP [Bdellovibrionota bacterium]